MLNNLINRLLYRYTSSSYIIQNRARFILYLILAILFLNPILLAYFAIIHMYDPSYDYIIMLTIFIPATIAFLISLAMVIVLVKGYYSIAGHVILISWQIALWVISFLADEEPMIRLDTLILISATLSMMPIIVVRKKIAFFTYTVLNIIMLFIFMITFRYYLKLSETAFRDYLSIITITYAAIGIISYTIYSINSKALERAEKEISEREKTEEQRNRLQSQLLQSQKLESVGLLAGGVAHDFNNMLSAVQGYAELASENLEPESRMNIEHAKAEISEIIKVSKKARDLTRQLLAFARVQPMALRNINLNKLVTDFTGMLSRTLRGNITIINRLCDTPGSIKGDPIQLEQVILNLALNAQDAMPDGGEIIIETRRISLDKGVYGGLDNIAPGGYILLSISDKGSGIEPEIIDKIFNPFYTTKDFGKGTGLGLSTVYGIIKQHNGAVRVSSEIGKGTIFMIYLPVMDETAQADASVQPGSEYIKGDETILAVEDTEEVRELIAKVLKKNGYNVIIAENARNALSAAESYSGDIQLLVTDVMMPDMDGMQLYRRIKETRPGIKIIYISGYTANIITDSGLNEEGITFIPKPFSVSDFTRNVREILDS